MKKSLTKIKHAVILVNYKSSTDTLAAIASIKKCKDQPYIIVVDNGSPQTVISELRANAPEVDLLEAGSNIGFSAGNNLGIKHALRLGAQVIYLLNNDTLVDPNLFFRAYRSCAGKNRIVGAKVYYARGYEYHDSQRALAISFGMLVATSTIPWPSLNTLE
jgi:GT2 family glycosyltransferase